MLKCKISSAWTSIDLEVSLLIKARTLTRAPHNEVSAVPVVVKSLLTEPQEEVRLLAKTGTGLSVTR